MSLTTITLREDMNKTLIRNCKFKFKCDKKWSDMEELIKPNDSVKHCKVCNEDVHLCDTDEQLITAIKNNWCVALFGDKNDETPSLLGEPVTTYSIEH